MVLTLPNFVGRLAGSITNDLEERPSRTHANARWLAIFGHHHFPAGSSPQIRLDHADCSGLAGDPDAALEARGIDVVQELLSMPGECRVMFAGKKGARLFEILDGQFFGFRLG